MKTTEKLLAVTTEIWKSYNEHPFVLGIQNGTLDKEKFRYYIIQDYLYLEDYHLRTTMDKPPIPPATTWKINN